jgi:hypothetical protein
MLSDILVPIAICLLAVAAAYIYIPSNKYKIPFVLLAVFAVILRIAVVFFLYRDGVETSGTDGLLYHQEGIGVARQLANGVPLFEVKYSYTWYTVFVGLIYFLFGVDRYLVSYINIFLAFISALLLYKMAVNQKYSCRNAAVISLVFFYFPNLLLWTADSRKESFLIFACFLCWHNVQRITCNIAGKKAEGIQGVLRNTLRLLLVCLLMWVCTLIRVYMFIPMAAGIVISLLLLYKKTSARQGALFAAVVAACAVLIFFVTMNPLTNGYHAISFTSEPALSTAEQVTSKMETVKTIASNRNIAVSIVNFLMLPYPGNINIADLHGDHRLEFIVSMDIVGWYACLLLMLTGIYSAIKKRESFFVGLIAFIASYVFINAMVVENVADTIYRYRSIIVGLSLLLIDGDILKSLLYRFESVFRGNTAGAGGKLYGQIKG